MIILSTGRLESARYPTRKPQVGPPLPPSWTSPPFPSNNNTGGSGEVPKFDVKKMKEAITTNLPIAAQALKEVFSNNEDNPLKSIMQMMKDPSFVGEDMASNLAGLAMHHGEDSTVMDMTEDPGFEEVNSAAGFAIAAARRCVRPPCVIANPVAASPERMWSPGSRCRPRPWSSRPDGRWSSPHRRRCTAAFAQPAAPR